MGDEHLDTISTTESNEFIKSSVENLVPSPSESEDLFDSECDIDSLLDEFAGEFILLKSIPPGIDNTDYDPEEEICLIEKLLYDNSFPRPPKEFIFENSEAAIESFSTSPILIEDSESLMEEINLSLTLDDLMPPGIEEDDYDSERDILIFEEFLSNDSLSLPENELLPTQPTLVSNQEKSHHLLSHWGLKASQLQIDTPMMIYGRNTPILGVSFLQFYPP
nr:hypothetical protein [Tanacetum cinerariifolium]